MARVSFVFLAVVAALITVSVAVDDGSSAYFAQVNPIRQVVSDGLRELENSFAQVIGNTRHVLSFARFAHR